MKLHSKHSDVIRNPTGNSKSLVTVEGDLFPLLQFIEGHSQTHHFWLRLANIPRTRAVVVRHIPGAVPSAVRDWLDADH